MADLGSLHRVLKDPTRRRILSSLSERGPLAYVELLGLLEIEHTGKLNYHLKLLGDLISKDDNGRYSLTEKGRLAVQIASKFQPASGLNKNATFREISWILLPLSVLSAYYGFFGSIDAQLAFGFISIVLLVSAVFLSHRSRILDFGFPQILGLLAVAVAFGLPIGVTLANNPFHLGLPFGLNLGPPLVNSIIFYPTILAWSLGTKGRREWALAVLIVSLATVISTLGFLIGVATGPGGFTSLTADIMNCTTTQVSPNGVAKACSGQSSISYVSLQPFFLLLTVFSARILPKNEG